MDFERLQDFNPPGSKEKSEEPTPASESTPDIFSRRSPEAEWKFKERLRCFKRWGGIGVISAVAFFAGEALKENSEKDAEWQEHVTQTLSGAELKKKEVYEQKIAGFFGERANSCINRGDKAAYFESKEKERKPPEMKGFLEYRGEGWTNMATYAFSESHLAYPRGWINGEVQTVEFVDEMRKDGEKIIFGAFNSRGIIPNGPYIELYCVYPRSGKEAEKWAPVSAKAGYHELEHANDWESDRDLKFVERQELLISVHDRMTSKKPYVSREHYHEGLLDGTPEGTYRAAAEYWAEICAEYFSDGRKFREKFPEDFALVDTHVRKNDPQFDLFNKDRGAFDPVTGELKKVWKNKGKK